MNYIYCLAISFFTQKYIGNILNIAFTFSGFIDDILCLFSSFSDNEVEIVSFFLMLTEQGWVFFNNLCPLIWKEILF